MARIKNSKTCSFPFLSSLLSFLIFFCRRSWFEICLDRLSFTTQAFEEEIKECEITVIIHLFLMKEKIVNDFIFFLFFQVKFFGEQNGKDIKTFLENVAKFRGFSFSFPDLKLFFLSKTKTSTSIEHYMNAVRFNEAMKKKAEALAQKEKERLEKERVREKMADTVRKSSGKLLVFGFVCVA